MVERKMRVYFLHNLDGRNCGIVAARTKAIVSRGLRMAQTEIMQVDDTHPNEAIQRGVVFASAYPGSVMAQPINARPGTSWFVYRVINPDA
jgi:hypothetical protein